MNSYWVVSWNDGQRVSSKDLITGDKINPWHKIIDYWKNNPNNLNGEKKIITHIELHVNGLRYNSPTHSKRTIVRSTNEVEKFFIFYKNRSNFIGAKNDENFIAYSYRCGSYRHIYWVNEKDNSTYVQVLNVEKPVLEIEERFAVIEEDINKMYSFLDEC